MGTSPITINDEALQTAMAAALLQTLTTEARDSIISSAIEHLMTQPVKEEYGRKTPYGNSPIIEAVHRVAEAQMHAIVRTLLDEDESFKERVRTFTREVLTSVLDNPDYRNQVAKTFVSAISEAMEKANRY